MGSGKKSTIRDKLKSPRSMRPKVIHKVDKRRFVELGGSIRRIEGRNEGHQSRRSETES